MNGTAQGPIRAARLVTPIGVLEDHEVTVADGRIESIRRSTGPVDHHTLAPGFIDLQVNGHFDVAVDEADESAWDRLNHMLWAQGVTTWCPTLVSAPLDSYADKLSRLERLSARPGPEVAGIHLEGPYIGARLGAHEPVVEGPVDLSWLEALPDFVRIVTIAPEREQADAAIALLADRGILVALGHTAATYEEALDGFNAGARLFTHCYNAATPMHHRNPGPIAAALTNDDVAITIIVDGVHVHPAMIDLAWRAKPPGRVILITDAVAHGQLGTDPTDASPQTPDGRLAGTRLTMDGAVRNLMAQCGVPLREAIGTAASAPAAALGLTDRGRIAPGLRADLVALDAGLAVTATWQGGESVFAQVV